MFHTPEHPTAYHTIMNGYTPPPSTKHHHHPPNTTIDEGVVGRGTISAPPDVSMGQTPVKEPHEETHQQTPEGTAIAHVEAEVSGR